MPKSITVKLPLPLLDEIDAVMKKQDKENRTSVICELLECGLAHSSGTRSDHDPRFNDLLELCSSKIVLQMNRSLAEVLRHTYDKQKSKYPECKDAESLLKKVSQLAQQTVEEYKGVEQKMEVQALIGGTPKLTPYRWVHLLVYWWVGQQR